MDETWKITPHTGEPASDAPAALPPPDAPGWHALARHLGPNDPAGAAFNAGWTRVAWTPAALVVDFAFVAAAAARNAARRLNEPTYLLGDVAELFLQWTDTDDYIEIHITPENQRLQLAWSPELFAAVRAGRAELSRAAVADPAWVRSSARVGAGFWSGRFLVPPAALPLRRATFAEGQRLRAAICRYDYSVGEQPVLSSTADFRGGRFHDRAAWHELVLETRRVARRRHTASPSAQAPKRAA